MKCKTLGKTALICSLLVLFILPQPMSAQGRRGGGLYGDWQIKFMFGENEMESILSFSRNREGQYTGQWISFMGMNAMKDVTFADNKLKFTQVFRFGDQDYTATFAGTIEAGREVAQQLKAGAVGINDASLTAFVHDFSHDSFGYSGLGPSRFGPSGCLRYTREQAILENDSGQAMLAAAIKVG